MTKRKQEFLIYSFLGWLLENSYHKMVTGTFLKPNFLHGPVKPMYGFGGIFLVDRFRQNPKHFGIAAVCVPLFIEWCSGRWLEYRYQLKYWDYSNEKIQIGGCICLKFAIYWMLLAQIVVHAIQPVLDKCLAGSEKLSWWKAAFCGFILDCVTTFYKREKAMRAKKVSCKK